MMKAAHFGLAAYLTIAPAAPGLAADLEAVERFSKTELGFEVPDAYSNVTLTVSGPNGEVQQAFSRRGAPSIDLVRKGRLDDGVYTYQLTAAGDETVKVVLQLDNGRGERSQPEQRVGATTTGTFLVRNGAIVPRRPATEKRVTGGAEGDDRDR